MILIALVLLCLVAAGCGGDDDSSGNNSATPTVLTTPLPTGSATPAPSPSDTPAASPTDSPAPSPSNTRTPQPTVTDTRPPTATATATEEPTTLRGRVTDDTGAPLRGVMITAYDEANLANVSVFTHVDGRFHFPDIPNGTYRVRAHRIGWEQSLREDVQVSAQGAVVDFTLSPTNDLNSQLPPTYFKSLLDWPNRRVAGDFSRACANCHQIGDFRWREPRTPEEWQVVIDRMIAYGGIPFFEETREVLVDTITRTFSSDAAEPQFEVPPPPSGDAVRAVIYEWQIDPVLRPGCHDLELGEDGTVYTVGGVWTFNPETGERRHIRVMGGGHSIERDPNGDMWITAPGPEELIKMDVATGELTHFRQPRIGDDLGSYPHTLRFDDMGRIWYTLTRSNHVCKFDPATEEFEYYRLPPALAEEGDVSIPVAYGCDVAPDQTVWWSQLFGHQIGRVDPVSGEVSSWRPPFDGPRRLRVGPDNVGWVPGYGSGELGRFDPKTETWKVYTLPTTPNGEELPYATAVNRRTGDVWITGSNSNTLIRFRPDSEEFTVFPLPTGAAFTREIEFGEDDSVWTCTSDQEIDPDTPGSGRIIKLVIREREGVCGDGIAQLGEDCDDGNVESCDGCSSDCRDETGCGDGVVCGDEQCDDRNESDCDGCSSACVIEIGSQCGDGATNEQCGEECDPPGDMCTDECQRVAVCGDGLTDAPEECDDGNLADCDGCSAACRMEVGCGDGAQCGGEACDDGNLTDCDGCSSACTVEVGSECGDGVINAECGEECDPPGEGCSVICTDGDGVLGNRLMTLRGPFFSSPIGTGTPLGELEGTLELIGGAIDSEGIAPVEVNGPTYYSAPILNGQFGLLCVRIDSCSGFVDCDGGTAVDTLMVQDSNGPGVSGLPIDISTGLGEPGPAGTMQLDCMQTFVQLDPGQGDDCLAITYPDAQRVIYTTGHAEAFFVNGAPKIGTGRIEGAGEPFSCPNWSTTDGPGRLAMTYLVEEDPRAGDVANLNVLGD